MQNLEIESLASIEGQQQEDIKNPEVGSHNVESHFKNAIEQLEQRVFAITDTFDLTRIEEPAVKSLELSKGKHLVVGCVPGESDNVYFYVTSKPGTNWYEHAVTAGHSINYHWVQEENSPLSLKIDTWIIDQTNKASRDGIELGDAQQIYNLSEAGFSELSNIRKHFNTVIEYIADPTL